MVIGLYHDRLRINSHIRLLGNIFKHLRWSHHVWNSLWYRGQWMVQFICFAHPTTSKLVQIVFFCMMTRLIKTVIVEDDPILSTNLLGFLLLSRGLGNVLSTPISTSLFQPRRVVSSHQAKLGFFVGGGKYEGMIVYVGTCFAASSIVALIALGFEKLRR